MAVGSWVVFCLLAVVTKLSSSVDDVAWLLPYINAKAALMNAGLYVLLMECVVGLAIAGGIGGREAMSSVVSEDGYWNTERVLSVVSGCLLTLYAVYLFYDWWTELEEEEEEDGADGEAASDTEPNPVSKETLDAASAEGVTTEDLEVQQEESPSSAPSAATLRRRQRPGGGGQGAWEEAHKAVQQATLGADAEAAAPEDGAEAGADCPQKVDPTSLSLVTVALLGSLDDFCVFFGLLLAGTFDPLQLVVGVFVGSCLVVAFCKGATFFAPVVWLLERIPLWGIIGCFAVWTFISAFVEM